MPRPRNPRTPAEWQDAVDAAHGAIALDSARKYGLVTGGPTVDVQRAAELLAKGRARGIRPRPDAIDRFIAATATHPQQQARKEA
jgi:hypothetical protein